MSKNQKGFTILELLIATMVFSVIFLGVTTVLIQMSKLYYKGSVTGRTQETARGTMDRIAQQLQFSNAEFVPASPSTPNTPVTGGPPTGLEFRATCIGTTRYTYFLNGQINNGVPDRTFEASKRRIRHALWRDTNPSATACSPADLSKINPSEPATTGGEMLDEHMRLSDFTVTCSATNICNISIGILYGDNDLLEPDPMTATPVKCRVIIGNQWCAASQFKTSVLKRIGS